MVQTIRSIRIRSCNRNRIRSIRIRNKTQRMSSAMHEYVRLLRPDHYLKNVLVFVPVFFARQLTHASILGDVLLLFVAFCTASSFVYMLNDLRDADNDRLHPLKKYRPIASNTVSERSARYMILVLLGLTLLLLPWLPFEAALLVLGYMALHVGYSFGAKHVPIVDIGIISAGFILRVAAGAVAAAVYLSVWVVCLTAVMAVLLALLKRRDDHILLGEEASHHRPVMQWYTLRRLNAGIVLAALFLVALYTAWAFSSEASSRLGTDYLPWSVLLVIPGIMRYFYLAVRLQRGGDPVRLLYSDRLLGAILLGWTLFFILMLYT